MTCSKSHILRFVLLGAIAAALALAGPAAGSLVAAQHGITVTNLGTLGRPSSFAYGISNRGQVVGTSMTADDVDYGHAFLWENGVMTDLGTLGKASSQASDTNDLGQVVGYSGPFERWHAFLWEDGVMTDLGTLGGPYSLAFGINNRGQVVGGSRNDVYQTRAFLWTAEGGMTDLGTLGGPWSQAYAINEPGQVVGVSAVSFYTGHAFLWTAEDGMTDLGTLGGTERASYAMGVNDVGQVVGWGTTDDGLIHAFLWTAEDGMIDLGTLGGSSSYAYGINNRGQVVGWSSNAVHQARAFLWTAEDGMTDLGTLGGFWSQAQAINELGQVVGASTTATPDGHRYATLWTIPLPDVYVFSEDIHFSEENPDKGEAISIVAHIHYNGSEAALDIPVTIYDIFPVGGVLQTHSIASTVVSFPDGGGSSPVVVSVPWANSQEGAHIIRVEVEPSFAQFAGNDKATRAIFVGPFPQVSINKRSTLLIDADGNGRVSPGDTLRYEITYENQSGAELSGALIIDDFEETLLETPYNLGHGGAVAGGTITWNPGTIEAGGSGTVTYDVDIKAPARFPTGRTVIANTALLTSDLTPPIAATTEVEVEVNVPPTVDAGGSYSGDEGSPVALGGASASDADGDSLTYAWTVDSALCTLSDATALNPTVTCADNGSYVATLTVSDGVNDAVSSDASLEVANVNPTIDAIVADSDPMAINQSVGVKVVFSDPGSADTHDVTWHWGDGDTDTQAAAGSPSSQDHAYAEAGVYEVEVTVVDDDGGSATEIYQFIVIYNPDGGFVSGGGWIWSQPGWCQLDALCEGAEGRAVFGFVSKYMTGATVPTGKTEFNFEAGGLKFRSDSYEWLVVNEAGTNAQFKGSGAINGELASNGEAFKFMLWATDQDPDADDTFRIRIWYEDEEEGTEFVVYDNGFDQPVEGGAIVVHAEP